LLWNHVRLTWHDMHSLALSCSLRRMLQLPA
jgi:hypothetical protein